MSEKEFAEFYVSKMSKNYPNAQYTIEDKLKIKGNHKEKEFYHYLDNVYNEYKLNPDSVDKVLNKYIASSNDLYKDPEPINVKRIVPTIKSKDYLDELRLLSKENGEEQEPWIVYEEYNSELIIVYGEDTENSVKYFTQEDFAMLSIPRDSLLSLSIRNLKEILPEVKSEGQNGTFALTAGGVYETSLILFEKLWTSNNFKVKGDIVVGIPTRDIVLIGGSKDKEAIKTMEIVTGESFHGLSYPVSPYLFKWDGSKFQKWQH